MDNMSNQTEQFQNDLKLIQEVEKHTNLYDPRCKDKDPKSRENTWSIIGKKLSLSPDTCKNRWKNLRDKYTREKKLMMIEGEESYQNHRWPLLDEMSFLWTFITHRKRSQFKIKTVPSKSKRCKYLLPPEWVNISDYSYNYEGSGAIDPSILDPTCILIEKEEILETNNDKEGNIPSQSKLRRLLEHKEDDTLHSPNLTNLSYETDNLNLFKSSQPIHYMDEEEYFCLSLAASLRRLPKQKSSLLKIKFMQILYDVQYGENKTV